MLDDDGGNEGVQDLKALVCASFRGMGCLDL